jgi:hypothetical protein
MNEIKVAIRQLSKSLRFTAVAAFTLALGIGAITTDNWSERSYVSDHPSRP